LILFLVVEKRMQVWHGEVWGGSTEMHCGIAKEASVVTIQPQDCYKAPYKMFHYNLCRLNQEDFQ
ncbi:hypothetical protein STEG23_024611, partial [Scotinomys teguina]